MANFGNKAASLLRDLKKAAWLPDFDRQGVADVQRECHDLDQMLDDHVNKYEEHINNASYAHHANVVILNNFMQRNKRCLLAYQNARIRKIEALRWDVGPVLPPEYFLFVLIVIKLS